MPFRISKAYTELNDNLPDFVAHISEHQERLDISDNQLNHLTTQQTQWDAAWSHYSDEAQQTVPAREAQRELYRELHKYMNQLRQYIKGNLLITLTAADYKKLQIHHDKTTRTHAPVPTLQPQVELHHANRLYIELRVTYETEPDNRVCAIPPNVQHVELEQAISNTMQARANAVFKPVIARLHHKPKISYDISQAGKWAIFRARYVNSRGEAGPWSETHPIAIM